MVVQTQAHSVDILQMSERLQMSECLQVAGHHTGNASQESPVGVTRWVILAPQIAPPILNIPDLHAKGLLMIDQSLKVAIIFEFFGVC